MAHLLSDYIGGWESDLDWAFGVESKPREFHRLWKSQANPFNFSYLGCGNNVGTNPVQPVANCGSGHQEICPGVGWERVPREESLHRAPPLRTDVLSLFHRQNDLLLRVGEPSESELPDSLLSTVFSVF
jgi:hypothetical protein